MNRRISAYDETCISCGKSLPLQQWHEAADYDSEFERECPACGKRLEIHVTLIPEFEVTDPNYVPPWIKEQLEAKKA